ncbi:hypothetical protein Hanom_Chr12g01098701 [Helianthus anomalus]
MSKFVAGFVIAIEFSRSFRRTTSHFLRFSPSQHASLSYLVPTPQFFPSNVAPITSKANMTR